MVESKDGDEAVHRARVSGADGEGAMSNGNGASHEPSRVSNPDEGQNGVSGRGVSKSRLASPNPSTAGRTPVPEDSAQSGTATRRGSISSQMSSSKPAVPSYGTRSRRQPRGSRPNYAEDVEMDFETQQPQENGIHSPAESFSEPEVEPPQDLMEGVSQQLAEEDRKRLERNAKRQAARAKARQSKLDAIHAAHEDTTPTSESMSGGITKKRKAAAVAAVAIVQGSQPAPPPAVTTKKPSSMASKSSERETNMVSFDKCKSRLNKKGELVSDDGQVFAPNDHVYLICEPPGEPYYLGRIMEFRTKVPDDPTTQVEYLRINWAYRPRDVQRFVSDSRMIYVTMHSDLCPLTSLRGKCQIKHRAEIDDIDEYRKIPNAFWFTQCFDRFIHRYYEVVPTSQVVNVPQNVKKAMDERWRYIVVEAQRVKELTSAVKTCTRCSHYCANDDSVDCALCKKTYHLQCVSPPLAKKPSRGFAWACGPCSREQERKLEARRTPLDGATDVEEEEVVEEEQQVDEDEPTPSPKDIKMEEVAPESEIAHAKMWPMRYLGIHCRVEDVLQYEDRAIYPRASSRLGPKHQANTSEWYGRPVQLVKPTEIKKRYIKSAGNKKDTKLTKDTQQAIEADRLAKSKRPKYVEDEPQGYVARGEDFANDDKAHCTAHVMFRIPEVGEESARGLDDSVVTQAADITDAYMAKARDVAKKIGVEPYSTDFLDRAVALLQKHSFSMEAALKELGKTKAVGEWPKSRWGWGARDALRDPRLTLSADEKKKFADGVRRYGSELRLVRQHVRSISHADTVRYWYHWKKTAQGRKIWGAYDGRKNASKKKAATVEASSKLLDDIADDHDDSAFDNQKVYDMAKRMQCKFCSTKHSRFWRRAPNTSPGETVLGDQRSKDKNTHYNVGLCQRCARLWRKYAIRWEDQDETAKKITQGGGKSWKRRVDEELIKEWDLAEQNKDLPPIEPEDMPGVIPHPDGPPAAKKLKGPNGAVIPPPIVEKKTTPVPPPPPPPPKEPTPPPVPNPPKMRTFPCAVCDAYEVPTDPLLQCRDCKLTVHRGCYGVSENKNSMKWSCDPCANDRREVAALGQDPAAYRYECVLCPVTVNEISMVEPPRVSHKKKTDRDRERERLEKELAIQFEQDYRRSQIERGRPIYPREALKRTADNKWVHVTCALWTPEVKFSKAPALEVAEGIPLIPKIRRDQVCKLCKTNHGACVSCHHCHASFHIACAYRANYIFGYDITPVKGSRRDGVNIVKLGEETGTMTAAIWCKEHSSSAIKTIIHYLNELVNENGKIALQLFAENYKQADLTLTGTARKANYLDEITKSSAPIVPTGPNRRISTATVSGTRSSRNSIAGPITKEPETPDGDVRMASPESELPERKCVVCKVDVSPKWWKHEVVKPLPPPPAAAVQPPKPNGLATNGLNHDRDPSRMDVDGPQLLNGHGPGPSIAGRSLVNGTGPESHTPAPAPPAPAGVIEVQYDCNKCHWRRINDPENLHPKKPESTPAAEPVRSPPQSMAYPGHPPPLPMHQPHHPGWSPFANGQGAGSPPAPLHMPPHHQNHYPPHQPHHAGGPQPGPGFAVGGPPAPLRHGFAPPPGLAHPPGSGPAPLHVIQQALSNGLPSPRGPPSHHSQHGQPPLRSPTHPPPNGPPSLQHRTSGSPFATPATSVNREPAFNGLSGLFGRPRAPSQPRPPVSTDPQLPSANGGLAQSVGLNGAVANGARPSTPRDPLGPGSTTPRMPHGASASPNFNYVPAVPLLNQWWYDNEEVMNAAMPNHRVKQKGKKRDSGAGSEVQGLEV